MNTPPKSDIEFLPNTCYFLCVQNRNKFSPMKAIKLSHITAGISLLMLLSACQTDTRTANQNFYNYTFDTAKIDYQVSGSSTGKTEVWIKGDKKKIINNITVTRADGSQKQYSNMMIADAGKIYSLDPVSKTGTMVKDPFYTELEKLAPEQRQARLIQEAVATSFSSDGTTATAKPVKTEEVAGQQCELYQTELKDICLWQGIPLKTSAKSDINNVEVENRATSIVLNQGVSDSDFQVPTDYQITNLN